MPKWSQLEEVHRCLSNSLKLLRAQRLVCHRRLQQELQMQTSLAYLRRRINRTGRPAIMTVATRQSIHRECQCRTTQVQAILLPISGIMFLVAVARILIPKNLYFLLEGKRRVRQNRLPRKEILWRRCSKSKVHNPVQSRLSARLLPLLPTSVSSDRRIIRSRPSSRSRSCARHQATVQKRST